MIEKICSRCYESKPIDQYSHNAARCHQCRSEAAKFSVQHHRQVTDEVAKNRWFNELLRSNFGMTT